MSHEEIWSKLSATSLNGDRRYTRCDIGIGCNFIKLLIRDRVLFEVATELEFAAISLSSTAEGYGQRINSMKDDIEAISQLERWDCDDRDFEDSQEIIQILRRCCIPKGRPR